MNSDTSKNKTSGSLLTISLENPPAAGRIIRNDNGDFLKVIEEQDCTEELKKINEINCGTYCFRVPELLKALEELTPDNNQNEYYLTDVPEIIIKNGGSVATTSAKDIFEILGVNTQQQRHFAENQENIKYAESLYEIIDASIDLNGKKANL